MAKWGKCDFGDLKKLQKKLEKVEKKRANAFCEALAKELAARLLAKVIKRTPTGTPPKFDKPKTVKVTGKSGKTKTFLTKEGVILKKYWGSYHGGTLKRGWTAKTENEAQSGGSVNSAEYAQGLPVENSGRSYRIFIINPVHYASYVEYGHRQRPGRYVPAIGKRLKGGWAKGRFMLTISEQQLQNEMPAIIEKKLTAMLKEVFEV